MNETGSYDPGVLARDIERGAQAERLLNDPLLKAAWDGVRQALLDKIETAPVRDREGREYLYMMLHALRDVRLVLEQAVTDGRVAVSIREEQTLMQKFKAKMRFPIP